MSIHTNSVSIANRTRTLAKGTIKPKASEASLAKKPSAGPSLDGTNHLVSREFLRSLADDYKKGLINGEEANTRFVSTVVNNAIDGKLNEKDRQELIAHIADFFSQEPEFLQNLEKNLKNLG